VVVSRGQLRDPWFALALAACVAACTGNSGSPDAGTAASASGGQSGSAGGTGGSNASGSGGTSGGSGGQGSSGTGGSGARDASMPMTMTPDAALADAGATADAGAADDDERCDVGVLDPDRAPAALMLSGDLGTHDPVVIAAHGQFYEFQTGDRIPTKTSTDLRAWKSGPRAFDQKPSWIAQQVPGATDLWAPDVSFFGGVYHLYYSASTFSSNHSCIGHATRAALDEGSWIDHGAVICSNAGGVKEDWNAIDPNVIVDRDGTPWLAFGSFWSGLKLIELTADGLRAIGPMHAIATRKEADGAIEAPYLVRRCGYYYLFASFDTCCSGTNSTYNVRVGRAQAITGPYVDRDGKAMLDGGGTFVVQGAGRWHGPGHSAVIFDDGAWFNVYHAYDANQNGASMLRISELAFDSEGWPVSGGP
jgi:arabinan endo-1,5-alpha-L-arabinosidase